MPIRKPLHGLEKPPGQVGEGWGMRQRARRPFPAVLSAVDGEELVWFQESEGQRR